MGILSDFSGLDPRALFIETGTGQGDTLMLAADYFYECESVEQDQEFYQAAVARFFWRDNVKLYHGNSVDFLRDVLDPVLRTVLWLDAHYTGNDEPMGLGGECPLLGELAAVAGIPWERFPVILVDDAFMFDRSLPSPCDRGRFNLRDWPTIDEIDAALPGYRRSLRGTDILEYRRADGRV